MFADRLHFLQDIGFRHIARSAGAQHPLLVTLDRIAIGSILRSKLVFLIIVQPRAIRGQHSAECVDIDNESNQVS